MLDKLPTGKSYISRKDFFKKYYPNVKIHEINTKQKEITYIYNETKIYVYTTEPIFQLKNDKWEKTSIDIDIDEFFSINDVPERIVHRIGYFSSDYTKETLELACVWQHK
tara:strand:- start:245 stop:574 length:330 start_codon:yes stop_codon:yes gene_type:complete